MSATKNTNVVARILHSAGIDKATLATLVFRFWSLLAGAITILLLPTYLDPTQQGYYYTFASILALQVFFELGMGQVVIQIVAHDAAYLSKSKSGGYEGNAESLARLFKLRIQLRHWYLPLALLFFFVVGGAGLFFFRNTELSLNQWAPAWVSLVAITAINLYLSWQLAMIEGFALVKQVNHLRFIQSAVGYALMWAGLLADAGLWIVVTVPLSAAIITIVWLRISQASAIFQIQSNKAPENPINWKNDVLPFQWRVAVSCVSGYFIVQLFTPLAFREFGAIEAGRIGLTMTIFNAVSSIGMSWVNSKAPNFSMLIAKKNSIELLSQFRKSAAHSILFTITAISILLLIYAIAFSIKSPIINRISDIHSLICLAIVTISNSAIFSAAVFMRSHREEPMLLPSLTGGLLIAALTWVTSKYGTLEMMVGYATVTVLVGMPWTLKVYNSYVARHEQKNKFQS